MEPQRQALGVTSFELVAEAAAAHELAIAASGVLHVEHAVDDVLAVADVGVIEPAAGVVAQRARRPQADGMGRQDAAVVLELQEFRPAQGVVDPGAVVQRSVHVTIRSVETAQPHGGLVAELVADLRALQVDGD